MQGIEHIAVVGAGAVGLSVALSLARRAGADGPAITVLDPGPPAGGASGGNAGVIVAGGAVPLAAPGILREALTLMLGRDRALRVGLGHLPRLVPWGMRALAAADAGRARAGAAAMAPLAVPAAEHWRADLAEAGHAALIADSLFIHASRAGPPDLEGFSWRVKRDAGVRLRALDRAALADLEPALAPDYAHGVAMEGMARLLDPAAAGRALAGAARARGVAFRRAGVRALGREGAGWRLALAPGAEAESAAPDRLDADLVVLAAGAASARLLAPLGIAIPLEAEHGRHVMLPEAGCEIRNSVMDTGARMVASAMAGGVRLAGSSAFTGHGRAPDAEADLPAMCRIARRMFPGIGTGGARAWAGSRPSLPDSLPALGPVPGQPGLWAAFGHGHYGLTMAPASGRLVAAMIAGGRPNIDPAPYDPGRFARDGGAAS